MSFWAAAMRPHSQKDPRQMEQRGDHSSYTRTRFRVHEQKAALANVERTKWSPKWSRTGDHGSILNGTHRHLRSVSTIQINTCQDRRKRIGTAINKFRVRCFQPLSHPWPQREQLVWLRTGVT